MTKYNCQGWRLHAEGATLICAKDKAQDIKKMVRELRADGEHDGVL